VGVENLAYGQTLDRGLGSEDPNLDPTCAGGKQRLVGQSQRCYTERAMDEVFVPPILVVSAKWETRTLLVAQIGEMVERNVISAPAVNEALGLIKLDGIDPALIVVDTGQQISVEDVKRLMEAKRGTPVVLVVSRLRREAFQELRGSAAAILARPVSIGRIAQTVNQVLKESTQ
jgi:DNA-binding NtrC family response regulator